MVCPEYVFTARLMSPAIEVRGKMMYNTKVRVVTGGLQRNIRDSSRQPFNTFIFHGQQSTRSSTKQTVNIIFCAQSLSHLG